ncbi:unnamed protein product [Lepeophtheirus salmonis]|uniref:(salmon louse) hypothetical protein n=1 Tax=Lepeophtheirus salmonis TaxID=72036 RepID=A0A7R8H5I7_LEPSM|nr:unnamed protein product [Lepeophtheirus salmonis]CAF2868447.1 unnamed protein product [Lepeophtheirus salmonis]
MDIRLARDWQMELYIWGLIQVDYIFALNLLLDKDCSPHLKLKSLKLMKPKKPSLNIGYFLESHTRSRSISNISRSGAGLFPNSNETPIKAHKKIVIDYR